MRAVLAWLLFPVLASCAGPSETLRGREGYGALGHDPSWLLTMRDGRLKFVGSEPKTVMEIIAPLPEPLAYGRRHASERLTLEVTHRPCNDVKSGLAFSDTVTVVVDGYRHQGCGGKRVPLLDI